MRHKLNSQRHEIRRESRIISDLIDRKKQKLLDDEVEGKTGTKNGKGKEKVWGRKEKSITSGNDKTKGGNK